MRRPPPKISERYLMNAALAYLRRYFTARAHLRRILMRKVDRSLAHHGGERSEATAQVDGVLDQLVASRILDDDGYARSKVEGLLRRGTSASAIHARLAAKGLPRELVQRFIDELGGGDELGAACAYARKRRLGPYADGDPQKELARMGRAGFSYGTARRVLEMGRDEIEEQASGFRLRASGWGPSSD